MSDIEKAKRDYPVGTKFHPAHINLRNDYCIITDDTVIKEYRGSIIAYAPPNNHCDDGKWIDSSNEKYGNTVCDRYLYYNEQWAKIMESPVNKEINNTYMVF